MNHQTLPSSLSRFRLGVYGGDLSQPMSLMRCLGPLSAMAREEPRLQLVFPEMKLNDQGKWGADLGWTWLAKCDAIYFSHPQSETDLSVLWLARTMNVPIWSEYVDDVFNVLPTNPHYQIVKDKRALREGVTQAIQWSSIVTSVSEICRAAYPHPERIVVIPEACLWPAWDTPRRKMVTWRGLASHAGDVETVLQELCGVAKDFPDWEWGVLGEPSEEFMFQLGDAAGRRPDGSARVKLAPYYSTPFHAIQAWGGCAPYLHIVPLANNAFNRAKSHLAWLEASAIGAAVLVPDHLPEWQQPGVIPYYTGDLVYNGKTKFGETLRREMLEWGVWNGECGRGSEWGSGNFHPNVAIARAAIYPQLTLPMMNQRRWAVLRKMVVGQASSLSPSDRQDACPTKFHSRSQAGQDRFVYELLVKPENLTYGTFLDIGSNDPVEINNTYALEQLGWRGVLVDLESTHANVTGQMRRSRLTVADAATLNWKEALAKLSLKGDRQDACPTTIDYVSLDVDEATLPALRNLLSHGVRFRVATIEHDSYRFGVPRRDEIRKLMSAHGYTLLCADVCLNREHVPFEDWFVDAKLVNAEVASRFKCDTLAWEEVFEKAVVGQASSLSPPDRQDACPTTEVAK